MTTGTDKTQCAAVFKMLIQIQQICESAIKWDEDKSAHALSDRAWLAKCILDILQERRQLAAPGTE